MRADVKRVVEAMGAGPLDEAAIAQWVRPLFRQAWREGEVYLAGHTLGRPPDAMQEDVCEGTRLWAERLREAWGPWLAEEQAYRAALARLLGLARADQVVPKTSAGQALRTVLNTLPPGATVLTTREEFASVAAVLAQYAALGRIKLRFAARDPDGRWTPERLGDELRKRDWVSLTVLSHAFYADGQFFPDLPAVAQACHAQGGEVLVDCYHSLGVVPVAMEELGCDYLIGGCYKYLRGGPGAAFLALAPGREQLRSLDSGWFALEPGTDPFGPWGLHEGPKLRTGGDGWVDGTPPVLTYYQARAGLAFVEAVRVERLRAYSLEQLRYLRELLRERGVASEGGDAEHGAFLTVRSERAGEVVRRLGEQGMVVDERGGRVRVCPDVLTTRGELERVAEGIGSVLRG